MKHSIFLKNRSNSSKMSFSDEVKINYEGEDFEISFNPQYLIDVLKNIVEKYSLSEDEFVYIGDDVNDLESLEFSKYRITVPHAPIKLKQVENIQITDVDGGEGAFREVVECLIG